MNTRPNDEMVVHLYHSALELLARLQFLSSQEIEKLREKFKVAAVREGPGDSLALRSFGNICEIYLNEALEYEKAQS